MSKELDHEYQKKMYNKYLKYQNKYIALKNSLKGGGKPFDNNMSLFIMAKITGDTLERINERRRIALGVGTELKDLHLTFLQLHVNMIHPNIGIFQNIDLIECIKKSFIENIINSGIRFESINPATGRGMWDFLGPSDIVDKYWARIYNFDPKFIENIRKFRKDIYDFLNRKLGQITHRREIRGADNTMYDIFSCNGNDLYAIVSDHYYGVENWKPHISVLKINELKSADMTKLLLAKDNMERSVVLARDIIGNKVQPISSIVPINDMTELRLVLPGIPKKQQIDIKLNTTISTKSSSMTPFASSMISNNFLDKISKSKPGYDTMRRVDTFIDPNTNLPVYYNNPKPIYINTPIDFLPNQSEQNPFFGFEWKIGTLQILIGNTGPMNGKSVNIPNPDNVLLYKMEESYRNNRPFAFKSKDVSYTFIPNDYHKLDTTNIHGFFINDNTMERIIAIRTRMT